MGEKEKEKCRVGTSSRGVLKGGKREDFFSG